DAALRQAAADGMDAFIHVFTEAYEQEMESNGNLAADTMSMLTAEQHSLLAYRIFRDEVMEGGFCQLIQNGYGGYIFDNPFAKVMRLWGIGDLSKLIYAAKKIYDAHRDDLERERTDEEFMAMYEEYEAFDDLEDEFLEKEEEYTAAVAGYVDEHIDLFATIV
ncbi:DMP19 family protein, partial [Bacteroides heparinolyticus]